VVAHHTENNLYASILQRFDILVAVIKDSLHILIAAYIHTACLVVIIDVRREKHNHVKQLLA
jgi:uncharacterized protein YqgV (UPF0045/DUF77 family)